MKNVAMIAILSLLLTVPSFAQMGGGGMGGGNHGGGNGNDGAGNGGGMGGMGGAMGGNTMIVVADDGSLLLNQGHGFMAWDDDDSEESALVNIATDGTERWRVSFEAGLPMMTETAGDLVVVNLRTIADHEDDDDWHAGAKGTSTLVVFDLTSGVELWSFAPEDVSMLRAQITDDASLVYVVTSTNPEFVSNPKDQGDDHGDTESTLYAFDRFGTLLWHLELN